MDINARAIKFSLRLSVLFFFLGGLPERTAIEVSVLFTFICYVSSQISRAAKKRRIRIVDCVLLMLFV